MALELLALAPSHWTPRYDHAKNHVKSSGAGVRLVPHTACPEKIVSRPAPAIVPRAKGALMTFLKVVLLLQLLVGLAAPYLS